jgi:hypothetical protein
VSETRPSIDYATASDKPPALVILRDGRGIFPNLWKVEQDGDGLRVVHDAKRAAAMARPPLLFGLAGILGFVPMWMWQGPGWGAGFGVGGLGLLLLRRAILAATGEDLRAGNWLELQAWGASFPRAGRTVSGAEIEAWQVVHSRKVVNLREVVNPRKPGEVADWDDPLWQLRLVTTGAEVIPVVTGRHRRKLIELAEACSGMTGKRLEHLEE